MIKRTNLMTAVIIFLLPACRSTGLSGNTSSKKIPTANLDKNSNPEPGSDDQQKPGRPASEPGGSTPSKPTSEPQTPVNPDSSITPTPTPAPTASATPSVSSGPRSCPQTGNNPGDKGIIFQGICWYLAPNMSCNTYCADKGGTHLATRDLVGSGGGIYADANCLEVANLHEPDFTRLTRGLYFSNRIIAAGEPTPHGIGCAIVDTSRLASAWQESQGMYVIREKEATNFDLVRGGRWRVCGCNLPPTP